MLQAFQIMLVAVVVTFVTGFFISMLIQFLCKLVGLGKAEQSDDTEAIALAIAIVHKQRTLKKQGGNLRHQ